MTFRLIHFDGNDAAYIQFLEAQILELQQALRSETHTRVSRFSGNQGDLDGDSNRQEAFRNTDDSNPIDNAPEVRRNRTHSLLEARGDRRHSAEDSSSECETLKVIEYDPTHNKTPTISEKQRQKENLSRFASFLDDLPGSRTWLGWTSAEERVLILRGLVGGYFWDISCLSSSLASKDISTPWSNSAEASIVCEYATSITTKNTTNRQAACVESLIFVSLCAVALRNNEHADKDTIYSSMRKVLRSDAQILQLQKLIRGARWANRAISLLTSSWKARAWDILFIAERPVSYYARLADSSLDPEELIKRMQPIDDHFPDESEENKPIPLAIPLIIERIFMNSIQLEDICECLGYRSSVVKDYRSRFNNALDSPSGVKRPKNTSTRSHRSKRHCPDNFSRRPDRDNTTYRARGFNTAGSPLSGAQQTDMPELGSAATNQNLSRQSGPSKRHCHDDISHAQGCDSSTSESCASTLPSSPSSTDSAGHRQADASEFPTGANTLPPQNGTQATEHAPGVEIPIQTLESCRVNSRINSTPSWPTSDVAKQPPAPDRFAASDSPHQHFNSPPELPEGLFDQPALDPFPTSDFPHQHFNNPPELPEGLFDQPALDPFPTSDFPHQYFNNPPELPEALFDQPALDPFPTSDFPHQHVNIPHGQPQQSVRDQFLDSVLFRIPEGRLIT